jgi:RHS repeat-associated protein
MTIILAIYALAICSSAGGALSSDTAAVAQERTEDWYSYDSNGNVIMLSDSSSEKTGSYSYDAFGSMVRSEGKAAARNQYCFGTKPYESDIKIIYYGYRYLSPATGRWISRDPLEESEGPNMYALLSNSPVTSSDKLGLARVSSGAQSYYHYTGLLFVCTAIASGTIELVGDCTNGVLTNVHVNTTGTTSDSCGATAVVMGTTVGVGAQVSVAIGGANAAGVSGDTSSFDVQITASGSYTDVIRTVSTTSTYTLTFNISCSNSTCTSGSGGT